MTCSHDLYNGSLEFCEFELKSTKPILDNFNATIFAFACFLLAISAMIVHRAVYKVLKRLGSRYINQIIIPNQVS